MAIDLEVFLVKLEERLQTIPGFNVTLEPVTSGTPPFGWIGLPPIDDYHATFGGARITFEPTVTVLVSKSNARSGTLTMARFVNPTGDQSVKACIKADKTIGGTVDDCFIVSFAPLDEQEVGILGYFGGRFNLRAIAIGN